MGLELFEKQKKLEEEKKLEVVNNTDSKLDELVVNLTRYFEQSILSKTEGVWQEDFEDYKKYLQGYQITPDLVSKVNLALPKYKPIGAYGRYLGYFLSALIQTSYDQGHNNFEFEKINAKSFGNWLQGEENKPIIVKVEKLNRDYAFWYAKNVVARIGELNGDWAFWKAKNIIGEIQEYEGDIFGVGMKNVTIYSPDPNVLKRLKRSVDKEINKFVLGKMPKELLK